MYPVEELKKLAFKLSLSDSVFFTGRVSNEELPLYYTAGDVYVLPTLYEGFGIVFLEAMASGLPIVSTTVDGVTEVVGDAGLLVPPKSPLELQKALIRIYKDKDLYQLLKAKGLSRVSEKFSSNKFLSDFETACLSLVKSEK